jgi:hypothetical protein
MTESEVIEKKREGGELDDAWCDWKKEGERKGGKGATKKKGGGGVSTDQERFASLDMIASQCEPQQPTDKD